MLQQITNEQEQHLAAIRKVRATEDRQEAKDLFEKFDEAYRVFIDTGFRHMNERMVKEQEA